MFFRKQAWKPWKDTGRKLEELAQELDNAWKRTRRVLEITRGQLKTCEVGNTSFQPPCLFGRS